MSEVIKTTVVFPLSGDSVLLGMKKRGFGNGWWNGFGGKLEQDETYEANAQREAGEEASIIIRNLAHVANLLFYFDDVLEVVCRAYTAEYAGKPQESDEMAPKLFHSDNMPYDTMWPGDKLWIPEALSTKEPRGFKVYFGGDKSFRDIETTKAQDIEQYF
jgi:8-oxo-dGTP pyrophosphatase MutT (NUDIX family)